MHGPSSERIRAQKQKDAILAGANGVEESLPNPDALHDDHRHEAVDDHHKMEAANDTVPQQKSEVSPESSEGRLASAVEEAPEGAIIFICGFEREHLEERSALLAKEKNVMLLHLPEDGDAVAAALNTAHTTDSIKIVADRPDFLKQLFEEAGAGESTELHELLERKNDPVGAIMEWLYRESKERSEEEEQGDPPSLQALQHALKSIRGLAAQSQRDFVMALPLDTPLGLFFFAYALKGEANPWTIAETREEYGLSENPVGILKIIDGTMSFLIDGRGVGTRAL